MFYRYHPDANKFAGIGFSADQDDTIIQIHYSNEPMVHQWIPLIAHVFQDNPSEEGDFPSLSNFRRVPVFSDRAWFALNPLIGYCCERLPIQHPNGDAIYSIIHVMDTIDALDIVNSQFSRNPTTGRINRIWRYAFKTELLSQKHIFKLPVEMGGELIVDDSFREIVESEHLCGLLFKQLPT